MSVLAWWVVPMVMSLIAGVAVTLWGRRTPTHVRGSFEEMEYFHRFLNALEPGDRAAGGPGERTSA